MSSQKTLYLVLNTMATLTKKLGAMDESISGLELRLGPSGKSSARNLHLHKQVKYRTTGDLDDDYVLQSPPGVSPMQVNTGILFPQDFSKYGSNLQRPLHGSRSLDLNFILVLLLLSVRHPIPLRHHKVTWCILCRLYLPGQKQLSVLLHCGAAAS